MSQSPVPLTDQPSAGSPEPGVLYCANHPTVETGLRCNNCEKPICPKCARLTPTGYRCKECISGQQRVFDTSLWYDYPLAFVVAGLLSLAGSFLATLLGFFIFILAPFIGVAIAEIVRFIVRRRRSERLFQVATVAAALGSAPLMLFALISMLIPGFGNGALLQIVWLGLYGFTVTSTVYYRLRGITIK